jgi:hypothetical protein
VFDATIDDRAVSKWLNKNVKKMHGNLNRAVTVASAESLTYTQKTLPKRTGNLRRMYKSKKTGDLQRTIAPMAGSKKSNYANMVEFGGTRPAMKAKHRKFLFFGITDAALTETRAQVSESAGKKFWNMVKSGSTFREATNATGVVAAKRVRAAKIPAQNILRDKVTPKAQKYLMDEVIKVMNGVVNG